MERTPKFCNKCGKELISNTLISEYDIYDGNPVEYTISLHCPDFASFLGKTNLHLSTVQEVTKGAV
jgi:hypothetical protein